MASLFRQCGLELSKQQLQRFWTYHQLLRRYNPRLNLTRIHNFTNMVLKLYVDSILPAQFMDFPSPLMDLGAGAGMPGIPLKIYHPHLEILLAESRKNRVEFLNTVVGALELENAHVVGRTIDASFERPVSAVVTRAVEAMAATLGRIRGCLDAGGLMAFMKGPNCQEEIDEALSLFGNTYELIQDKTYRIPETPHQRRLAVFRRLDEPTHARKGKAMKRHAVRRIESESNAVFKDLGKLLGSKGIRRQNRALVSGSRQVHEILRDFPDRCQAWIGIHEDHPPPREAPDHVSWLQLPPRLFKTLDLLGTRAPLLLIRAPEMADWTPLDRLSPGCTLLIPFQDPENVGAVVRSAVAFGVREMILLAESAHPFHPKALRSSGGAALRARFFRGPSIRDLPETLPVVSLSAEGAGIEAFDFPEAFALLPGLEGPGLPPAWREKAVSIPMSGGVESLNASVATGIALYVWSRRLGSQGEKLGS